MLRVALQSAIVGALASAFALWARFVHGWWPWTPFERAAYFVACPACPIEVFVLGGPPRLRMFLTFPIVGGAVYAGVGVLIEAARRMRRGA